MGRQEQTCLTSGRTSREPDTMAYNKAQPPNDRKICDILAVQIDRGLPEAENRIWHAHPVWFLDGNPVVGYSKLKSCVRLTLAPADCGLAPRRGRCRPA